MDDTDRKLALLLEEDPRMSFRDISRILGISRQTAHSRLEAFSRKGWFKGFMASPHYEYFGIYAVAIWGQSNSTSYDSVLERLGRSKSTYQVEVLGGNMLYVIACFTEVSDLDSYVQFVRTAAEMPRPTVGIMCEHDGVMPECLTWGKPKAKFEELHPLDFKILTLLTDNPRKPVSEIAAEIGISAKTIRRHLDKMIADNSISFEKPWDMTSGEDVFTLVFVRLRDDANKVRAARRLLSLDQVHFTYLRAFGNIPGLLVGLINSARMREIRKILRKIAEDEDVLSVTPNLIYEERVYYP